MKKTLPTIAAALLALPAFGQTTTIEVPQGSGVFPTIGQINCLEEPGGRYCAPTWECGAESGELWGDLPNHDGRRALVVDSPVARRRSCVIEVDGEAEAVWFTAHTPERGDSAPFGLSPVPTRRRPLCGAWANPSCRAPTWTLDDPRREVSAAHGGEAHDRRSCWVLELQERRGANVAAVALANKNARTAWALLAGETEG